MGRFRGVTAAVLTICMALVSGSLALSLPAEAVPGVTVDLSDLSPADSTVEVSPSLQGDQTLTATITVTKPPPGVATVDLNVSSDTNWQVVVSPATVTIAGREGSQNIAVAVTIPKATSAETVGKILLTATMNYLGMTESDTSTATIHIAPYFRIGVFIKATHLGAESLDGLVLLENGGNTRDTFSQDGVNQSSADAVKVRLGRPAFEPVTLAQNGSTNLSFHVPVTIPLHGRPVKITMLELAFTFVSEGSRSGDQIPIRRTIRAIWLLPPPNATEFVQGALGFNPFLLVWAGILASLLVGGTYGFRALRVRRSKSRHRTPPPPGRLT